jgi:DNA modification methylase
MRREPYINDADFQLYCGDAREVLADLPAESVHCALTSPPFF